MPGWLLYFFRLAFFLPVIIAAAFVSIVWGYFYGDDLGVINYYLQLLGLPGVRWLTDADQAMTSIIIMDVWKNTGFFMIIFIAALQGVPKNIIEAAVMDGTPAWRRFFRITLPCISPVVFFCIVYASIGALQVYESIVILTQGGPGDATRSMSIHIVEEAFGSFQIGYAASIAVVMTVVILIITAIQQLLLARLGAAMSARRCRRAQPSAGSTGRSSPCMVAARRSSCCCRSSGCSRCRSAPVADAYKMPPSFLPPSLDFTNYRAVLSVRRAVPADLLQLGADRGGRHRRPARHLHARRLRLRPAAVSAAATRCSSSCWSG